MRLIHISLLAVELQEKNEVAESCNIWYNKKGIEIFVAKKQNTIKKRMFLIVFFFHITY